MFLKIKLFVIAFALVISNICCSQKTTPIAEKKASSLYQAYAAYFPIGAAYSPALDSSQDRQEWIPTQYNSITPENQLKPKFLHPEENLWDWEPADKIIGFAKANDMKIRGHALVWFQSTPDWMLKDGTKSASKELLKARLKEHISTTMNRYKGSIYCWDVVNEAISNLPEETFRAQDGLYKILGEDYIAEAFKIAKEIDPDCQLYYNDYRFSDPVKREKIYQLMKRMLAKGVPIDGIGFQSHLVPDEITERYFQETIDMFSTLGLKIQITELDISVFNYRIEGHPDLDKNDDAYTPERIKKQTEMYDMVFRVCRKNKDKITGITFWGTSDARDNYRTKRIGKMDYPFIFDENMKAKSVFDMITNF